jgi:CRP/FNR family cyclic AMP-dependent transcriptional regulator
MTAITSERFSTRFPGVASSLGSEELDALLAAFELHDADAGEALVAEGTPTSDLFLVWEGNLDVTTAGTAGRRTLARVAPGSCFGEVALLDPGPAGASVVTEQGCVALRLSRARFDELRRVHPDAAASLLREVLQSLAARVRRAASLAVGTESTPGSEAA